MRIFTIFFLIIFFSSCLSEPKKTVNKNDKTENERLFVFDGEYYEVEGNGQISIKKLIDNSGKNILSFELITWSNDRLCDGELSGIAEFVNDMKAIYSDPDCQELTFIFELNKVSIKEKSCSYYHGFNCFFSGDYQK